MKLKDIKANDFNIINPHLDFDYLHPLKVSKVDAIVLHHSEGSNSTIQSMHRYHKSKGWSGIGYNFIVDKLGNIYMGRGFNIGAQCHKNNSHTIGICAIGNYMTETMPRKQKLSIIKLCNWLKTQFQNIKRIEGHNYYNNTDCPGKNFPINEIKYDINNPVFPTKNLLQDYQVFLNSHRYTDYEGKKLVVDGISGRRTKSAHDKFMEDVEL